MRSELKAVLDSLIRDGVITGLELRRYDPGSVPGVAAVEGEIARFLGERVERSAMTAMKKQETTSRRSAHFKQALAKLGCVAKHKPPAEPKPAVKGGGRR
jgi:hypothetical protein